MKAGTLLLALSILANAALLAAYLRPPSRPAAAPSPSGATAGSAAAGDPVSVRTGEAGPAANATSRAGFSWAAIETNDLQELARRLKAAGFSRAETRAILFNRIERNSPWHAAAKTPYWQSTQINSPDPKAAQEHMKLLAEHMKLQQQSLSPEDYEDPDYLESVQRRWGRLPVEKIQALARIEADYQALAMEESATRSYRPGEESNAADTYQQIQNQRMADTAAVLTPEEFAEFERRASPTADRLRVQLEVFRPSEAEYLAIFDIHKAYAERLSAVKTADAYRILMEEVNAGVKTVLGEDRMLDYAAATTGGDQTARLVSRLGLPARVATEVRQAQQDFTRRGQAIRANAALSAAERNAQLAALAKQAETHLTTHLGTAGFEAYSDMKGEWLRNLKPPTGPGGP